MALYSADALAGRYALVLGGTSGIGRAIAAAYLQAGARVIVVGRDEAKLAAAVEGLKPLGDAHGYAADLADPAGLAGVIGLVLAHHGHLDILVNCQGTLRIKPALEATRDDWQAVIGTNLESVFFACQEVGRHMIGRDRGAIVNIASLSSYRGWPNGAVYGISKAGIVSLTETLATEWAPHGVRVNAIAPGVFLTEINRDRMSDERKRTLVAHTPMGRFGEVHELAGAALFLASDASGFMTGETIRVDGGFLAGGLARLEGSAKP
jgi:NAD(P)-dependent dehydrogenase (short-subunit alcohol dehydrogenase family)